MPYMPYFVRLTSFTSEGAKALKSFSSSRKQFLSVAKKLNVNVLAEYVLTGKYDIITILEAPDLETVLKMSASIASTGRTRTETYAALTADEFEKISKSI